MHNIKLSHVMKKRNEVNTLDQSVLQCSRSGNVDELRDLLNDKQRILKWRHKRSGESLFLLIARYGHLTALHYLVAECNENIEQQNNDGKRALHEVVLGGHFDCVKYLIERNVEVDSLKRADWTPLMLACTRANLAIVSELIFAGANPKLVNKDGWNCFHIAVREGHGNIIQYLLNVCPDIWNTLSNNGRTPLHTAALHGHLQAVSILLKCGQYTTDQADSCGTTPLIDALRGGHIAVASILITEHHSSIRAKDKLGRQSLHIAAQSGSISSLRFLVKEQNINVHDVLDYCGMTPLHIAAKEGNCESVLFLLSSGSEINQPDKNGRTALHLSSAAGQTRTVESLLKQRGIHVDLRDKDGLTAEDLALKMEVKELFMQENSGKDDKNHFDKSSKIS